MYDGYLIKINNATLPNRFLERDSWQCTPMARKVLDSFFDVEGEYHEYLANHERSTISFRIREHTQAEHAVIVPFLQNTENLNVSYYNDREEEYKNGYFKMDTPAFTHKKTFDGTIWYNSTTIKLTEY